jgi:ATP-binding protein involved in chromosome partitioning
MPNADFPDDSDPAARTGPACAPRDASPMTELLTARVERALRAVANPRTGTDVITGEQVRDVATTTDGKVQVTLLLDAKDDPTLVRDVRKALERVEGVTGAEVRLRDPSEFSKPAGAPAAKAPGMGKALPVMGQEAAPKRPAVPEPVAFPNLGRIIAVSSGKGGVGKSTVTTNLAVALAQMGYRVGLMDADIYGPNIPRMMGVNRPPPVADEKIQPLEAHGVKLMSLGFMIDREQPAIWRGPIVMKIIGQFLRDVDWGQLDYLLVDMPPGTGDAQLSLVQTARVHGAVIVTTPQQVAVGDALRGVKMFERVAVPVLGVVENMSWFESPETGQPIAIFGSGGGKALADEVGVPLLGHVPLHPRCVQAGDEGRPIVASDPDSNAARALREIAAKVAERVGLLHPA